MTGIHKNDFLFASLGVEYIRNVFINLQKNILCKKINFENRYLAQTPIIESCISIYGKSFSREKLSEIVFQKPYKRLKKLN